MTIQHGWELLRDEKIAELNARATLYRHVATGAELLSLENDDENKVFGITFRTPPEDSTGLPHILEHSVLCGSDKYPVKEPFVELIKGSLNTFLNAFTYPDKTCYPVASTNLQDFYNLVDVYVDAVFHPRLTPQVLQQEGWHYEVEEPDKPLIFKGVVFNEMKGAYSSPEGLLSEYTQQTLFPDNAYGVDSGGDPRQIPNLTWEQFKSFHERLYHPSNSRIFFYGDDPAEERLRLMNEYLAGYEHVSVASGVDLQPTFDEPKHVTRRYPVSEEESHEKKAMVAVSWLLPEVADFQTQLSFSILDYILIETPASPLRKALIESGLGEDLSNRGLSTHLRQMFFSTGLKGIKLEDADKVEALILSTLERLAEEGIDPRMVGAALNSIEFDLRENNTGSYPRGLALMLRALTPWLYEGDPLAALAFEQPLERIKAQIAAGDGLFETMIRENFLHNPHRVTLVLEPDPDLAQQWEREERARLDEVRAGLSDEEIQRLIEETAALKRAQETPDSAEALASIPRLGLDDLEREQKAIPIETQTHEGATIVFHDLATSGIAYVDLGMNLHVLPEALLPFAPLFGRALLEMGTEGEDFVRLSQRIDQETGGIRPDTLTTVAHNEEQGQAWLFLRGKALVPQVGELLAILRDVLLTVKLDNPERFRQIVLEEKAGLEASLIPMGHRVVNRRLRAHFTEADWADEQLSGIAQLEFLRALAQQVESDWPSVLDTLERVRATLVNRSTMLANVTVDEESWESVGPQLRDFVSSLPQREAELARWSRAMPTRHEGLAIPAPINYVGKAANLYDLGYELDGAAIVVSRFLRTSYLWDRVRVRGGAYGAFSLFVPKSGIFSFLSYRDPNLLDTLDIYAGSADFLRDTELDEDELVKSIIGAISDLDSYQLPDAKGWTSLERFLAGTTPEYLQTLRDEVLGTGPATFRAFAEALGQINGDSIVVVMGGQDNLKAANESLEQPLDIKRVL